MKNLQPNVQLVNKMNQHKQRRFGDLRCSPKEHDMQARRMKSVGHIVLATWTVGIIINSVLIGAFLAIVYHFVVKFW